MHSQGITHSQQIQEPPDPQWLARLREGAAERQCPRQLPTTRWWAIGGVFPVSRSFLLVRSLLPRHCPKVVLSTTHKRRKTEKHSTRLQGSHPTLFSHFTFPALPASLFNEDSGLDNSQGTSQLCRQYVLALDAISSRKKSPCKTSREGNA